MTNSVQGIFSFEKKKDPTKMKFQYMFSNTLVNKWQNS